MQKMTQLHKEQKLAVQRAAAKNTVISQTRKDRGLVAYTSIGEGMGDATELHYRWTTVWNSCTDVSG